MVESSSQTAINTARNEAIIFWIITDKDYSQLRKVEGCENLSDLNATKSDSVHILNFAKKLGVKDGMIFRNEAATVEDLKKTYKEILKITRKFSVTDGRKHTLIVYCGGHGASLRES